MAQPRDSHIRLGLPTRRGHDRVTRGTVVWYPLAGVERSAMPTHVALLRGINLAGRNKIAMAELRGLMSGLGHTDVATYIQSGNVVFSATTTETSALAAGIERAISDALGLSVRVVVLSRAELEQVLKDNPFPDEPDPKLVHAMFLNGEPTKAMRDFVATAIREVAAQGSRDAAQFVGRTLYLHTPDGYGRSELAARLARPGFSNAAGVAGTARNWATVTRLHAMCQS